MSISDGKFHDLELSYYSGDGRIDDERNKPIAYTLFRDTINKGFINDVISDEAMRVDVYPKPGLLLGNVRIGTDKDEIRIALRRVFKSRVYGNRVLGH